MLFCPLSFKTERIEHEEVEKFYKPVRVTNFWSNNYFEYESNGDRNKTLSVKEYINKTRPYNLK